MLGVVNTNYIMVDVGTNGRTSHGGVLNYSKFGDSLTSAAISTRKNRYWVSSALHHAVQCFEGEGES